MSLLPVGTRVRIVHDTNCAPVNLGDYGTIELAEPKRYDVTVDGKGTWRFDPENVEALEPAPNIPFGIGQRVRILNSVGSPFAVGSIQTISVLSFHDECTYEKVWYWIDCPPHNPMLFYVDDLAAVD